MLTKAFLKVVVPALALAVAAPAWAGENPSTKITKIGMWNEFNQVLVMIGGTPQPSTGWLWFDSSTVLGKNLLSLLTAAQLSGRTVYVSWVDAPDSNILGTSANKLSGVSMY